MAKKKIQVQIDKKLTEREQNESAIRELTADWPVEDLDSPEKIKKWLSN